MAGLLAAGEGAVRRGRLGIPARRILSGSCSARRLAERGLDPAEVFVLSRFGGDTLVYVKLADDESVPADGDGGRPWRGRDATAVAAVSANAGACISFRRNLPGLF